jgi:uncharacterized protein
MKNVNISDRWAYDVDKKPSSVGEVWDVNCLNQSIEMILGTARGERLFMPNFGSGLQYRIFNAFTESEAESLLNEIIDDIRIWEDRIVILSDSARIIANVDENYIILIIPYIVKSNGISSVFKKKIVL